ncbi:hypothetical protein [Candidatus Vidania fulgoroideorum]
MNVIRSSNDILESTNINISKSVINRTLVLSHVYHACMTFGTQQIFEDLMIMIMFIYRTGGMILYNRSTMIVYGNWISNKSKQNGKIYVKNAGTVLRPILTLLVCSNIKSYIYGNISMSRRPVNDLIECLYDGRKYRHCVRFSKDNGYLPISIFHGCGKVRDQYIIKCDKSSQYVSSLLMIIPKYQDRLVMLKMKNFTRSQSYLELTKYIIRVLGISFVSWSNNIIIKPFNHRLVNKESLSRLMEMDMSSISYYLVRCLIKKTNTVFVIYGVRKCNKQYDIYLINIMRKIGVVYVFLKNAIILKSNHTQRDRLSLIIDCRDIPDSAITLLALVFDKIYTVKLFNIFSLNHKETNRIYALCREMSRIGCAYRKGGNWMIIKNKTYRRRVSRTYNDHRIAMIMGIIDRAIVNNPNCTKKTFPAFFKKGYYR